MSGFAVRNDGVFGFRSVGGPDELFPHEVFSEVEPPAVTPALALEAKAKRDQLLAIAANRMGPLQDAADIGLATDEEVERLTAWKGYRIDLNRIEQQAGFPTEIQWPLSPDEQPAPEPVETPTE